MRFLKETRVKGMLALLIMALSLWQGPVSAEPLLDAIRAVEEDLGARVGVYVHDTHSGDMREYNADARFPLNSTFKLFACAALLSRVESGQSDLSDSVDLRAVALESYSPAVSAWMEAGNLRASYDDLCRMMLAVSDNTAANLVLAQIGGPEGFTRFLRALGDPVTRLDRWETALNEGTPGDPRDTTTPRAIGESLGKLLLGEGLTGASKEILRGWLAGHRVADALFRAALPAGWSIDDRTGAGGYGTRGIVAVIYPPGREPIVATMYLRDTDASLEERNAAIASVGKAIVMLNSPDS